MHSKYFGHLHALDNWKMENDAMPRLGRGPPLPPLPQPTPHQKISPLFLLPPYRRRQGRQRGHLPLWRRRRAVAAGIRTSPVAPCSWTFPFSFPSIFSRRFPLPEPPEPRRGHASPSPWPPCPPGYTGLSWGRTVEDHAGPRTPSSPGSRTAPESDQVLAAGRRAPSCDSPPSALLRPPRASLPTPCELARPFPPLFLLCWASMATSPETQYTVAARVVAAVVPGRLGPCLHRKWARLIAGVLLLLAAPQMVHSGEHTAVGEPPARRRRDTLWPCATGVWPPPPGSLALIAPV